MTNHQSSADFLGQAFFIPNSPSIPHIDSAAKCISNPPHYLTYPNKIDERIFSYVDTTSMWAIMKGGDFYRRTVVC